MNPKLPLPLADEQIVQHLLETTRQGDTIGDFIFFGASGVEIAPDELKYLLRQRQIERWLPVDIKPRVAMRKAITEFKPALEKANLKVLIRMTHEDDQEVRYSIIGEKKGLSRDLQYATVNQVVLDKRTGELGFTGKAVPEIERLYNYLCSIYTQRELLAMTKNIMKAFGGIALKAHGGMWFMPASARTVTNALRDLFNQDVAGAYGKAYYRCTGIKDTEDAHLVLGAALQEEIDTDLESAAKNLQHVLKSPNPRSSSLQHAVNRIKEVRGKVEVYRGLVEVDLEWIDQAVEAASKRMTAVLVSRQASTIGADYRDEDESVYLLEVAHGVDSPL